MPTWKEYKLSEIMEIIGGGTPKTTISEYWNGNIPWLSVVDFGNSNKKVYNTEKSITELGLNNSSTKILKNGQIIISARGTVGALAVLGRDMAFNQSCYGLNALDNICVNDYLYYLLKVKIDELKRNAHGAVFDTITRTTFETVTAELPDLPTQTAIAEILSSLDDKIELNNQINQELEALAKSLFKQWFIDFEFPNENGLPYKSSGGEMVESELGEIPKGWAMTKIGDLGLYITDLVANGSFATIKDNVKTYETENFAIFIRNTDLKNRFKSQKIFVDEHSYNFLSKSKLFGGEIILPNVGDVGTVHMCPNFKEPMTLGNNCIMVRSEKMQNWLYTYFKSDIGFHSLKRVVIGSVQDKLSKTNFKGITIPIPNADLLNVSESNFKSIYELQQHNNDEISILENLRDSILPKLISGELEVSEALTEAAM